MPRLHLFSAADDQGIVSYLHIYLFSKVLHRRCRVSLRRPMYLLMVGSDYFVMRFAYVLHVHMCHDSFICHITDSKVKWLMRHDSFICDMIQSWVTCLIHMRHDSIIYDMTNSSATWRIICDMNHLCETWHIRVWLDSFTCDTSNSWVGMTGDRMQIWQHLNLWQIELLPRWIQTLNGYLGRANAPRYQKTSSYDKNLHKRVLGSAGDLSLKPGMFTKIRKYFGRGAVKGGRERSEVIIMRLCVFFCISVEIPIAIFGQIIHKYLCLCLFYVFIG